MSTLATREDEHAIWTFPAGLAPAAVEPGVFRELLEAAREAKGRAYSPYSKFQVGAAVRVEEGSVFSGANLENASYGATICAERAAISIAVTAGYRRLEAVAVSTSAPPGTAMDQRSPCGICRQVIGEFAGPETLVVLDAGDGEDGRILGEVIPFNTLFPWRFRLG